ncbi:hypothetical protein R8Z50_14850 [Longispora sp. K20-0274]|uniref:hypothetical protein n=1 Tax=Longispora sp. K20-0274 TaxID=3088255 RepID=UPI003999E886
MTRSDLRPPQGVPRVPPLAAEHADGYVRAAYDLAAHTWGIPNNLVRTMGWLPALATTEVAYANAFIFDDGPLARWPSPADPARQTLLPYAGFVDRVTKELLINLVSLLNRSRYSITHHTVIGFATLTAHGEPAEEMLLHLVDSTGKPDFEAHAAHYRDLHLHALRFALAARTDPHAVTDEQFAALRAVLRDEAKGRIAGGPLAGEPGTATEEYLDTWVNGALVELTWLVLHFDGLLNRWFTLLRVPDETSVAADGIDFVAHYNATVPERLKVRNNNLLGPTGWGR